MINLHYSKNESEIIKHEFTAMPHVTKFLHENVTSNVVYLISCEGENLSEVYITTNKQIAIQYICCLVMFDELDLYYFEFASYEEAYKVALLMQEVNPLCYEKK